MTPARSFDRSVEDVGNILNMEHFNLTVPDQQLAALFYVSGLGFTRDPYMDFGTFNMWINVGEQQFHLPKNTAQKFRGYIAIIVPDLGDLKRRLNFIARPMEGTEFDWTERTDNSVDYIDISCPWGNSIRAYGPDPDRGMSLGIAYGVMNVRSGVSQGIADFYQQVFDAPARVISDEDGVRAVVSVGFNQDFIFRETDDSIPEYDGHHIAIYVANFSSPHRLLKERELITEESDQHQYRFEQIVDPNSGDVLTEIEHEVRSLYHPMRRRVLVNRNASQTFGSYQHGRDIFVP